jgi:hypothetical protein
MKGGRNVSPTPSVRSFMLANPRAGVTLFDTADGVGSLRLRAF